MPMTAERVLDSDDGSFTSTDVSPTQRASQNPFRVAVSAWAGLVVQGVV